jgi:ribose transport system substrate-binding protein
LSVDITVVKLIVKTIHYNEKCLPSNPGDETVSLNCNRIKEFLSVSAVLSLLLMLGVAPASAAGSCSPEARKKLEERIAQYEATPKFLPPGPAFDASKAKGKTIFNIPLLSTDTFNQIVDKAEAEAAQAAGVKFIQFNNEGTPSQWVNGMNQAIGQKVDLIILEGSPDPRALTVQLAEAKAAGIPVISTHFYDESAVKDQLSKLDLTAIVPANHYLGSGTLTASYAMLNSDCNVNALILEASEVQPTSPGITKRFKETLAEFCPDTCKAQAVSIPFGEWAQKAALELQTKLNSDPTINFIAPNFDQGAIYARQAIVATGAEDRVKIVAYNGSAPIMQMLANKESVIVEVGEPLVSLGWYNMDQALRILSGQAPTTVATPVRMFDANNIAEAGNPVDQVAGYGRPEELKDEFKKLWGLSK